MNNTQCVYFYRVHFKLIDNDLQDHLSFDFPDRQTASAFAEMGFKSSDCYKVWIEIVINEVDTTESPMWRWKDGQE